MPTADQVKALIRSHADGDDARFYAIAMQVAAHAARTGHARFAADLRKLIDDVRSRERSAASVPRLRPLPIVQPKGELAGLLTVSYPKARFAELIVERSVVGRLERVLTEQRQRTRIREHGLEPMRKLLLVGPPGTGKTMTAGVLAGELGLPLLTIQFDGLISRYLGETAAKLRLVFDAMREQRAVYLFDEFDALGAHRASPNDVGEIRRVLNSFLLFIKQDESDSVIVAATNFGAMLDAALFRRFDTVIEYGLPGRDLAEQLLRNRLALLDTTKVDWTTVIDLAAGQSHAELARACEQAAKDAILAHTTAIDTNTLLDALRERGSTPLK